MTQTKQDVKELLRLGSLLGKEVETPDGTGILISVQTDTRVKWIDTNQIDVTVWYGVDKPQGGWLSRVYRSWQVRAPDSAGE